MSDGGKKIEMVPEDSPDPADDDQSRHAAPKSKASHPSRSRRKISMPWFRQSSFGMSLARLRLPKQHTIATENLQDEKQPAASPERDDAVGVSRSEESRFPNSRL
jgi:hypothetical protein